jgi:protein phosphatase
MLPEGGHFAILRVEQDLVFKHMEANQLQTVALTNQGLERSRNEDSCFAASSGENALLVVADGMGGHRAGNVASDLVIKEAEKVWLKLEKCSAKTGADIRNIIEDFIREANRLIIEEADQNPSQKGMGTTVTAALLCGQNLTVGHVGDSRAYLINAEKITPITRDHSLPEHLIESGQITEEEARFHPQRHILTRALGISAKLTVDVFEEQVEQGSAVLLCTDGLTNMVRDEEILATVNQYGDPQQTAEALIEQANKCGGFDNITVVIATGIGGRQA